MLSARNNCYNIIKEKINVLIRSGKSKQDIYDDITRRVRALSTLKAASIKPASTSIKSPLKYVAKPSVHRENLVAPAIKAAKVSCRPTNPLKRVKSENDAAKPSVHRESCVTAAAKAVKVPSEPTNPPKRLKSELYAASTNAGLDSSFLDIMDTVFVADYDVSGVFGDHNVGEPSMISLQVVFFCLFDSCIVDNGQY